MQNTQTRHQLTNPESSHRTLLLKYLLISLFIVFFFSLTTTINTTLAGGRTAEPNLMDDFLQKQSNSQTSQSVQTLSTLPTTQQLSTNTIDHNALVFNRGATGVDVAAFNTTFSLNKTLEHVRNSSHETSTSNSNTQLLGSLLNTFNTTTKANGFVNMPLQARSNEAS